MYLLLYTPCSPWLPLLYPIIKSLLSSSSKLSLSSHLPRSSSSCAPGPNPLPLCSPYSLLYPALHLRSPSATPFHSGLPFRRTYLVQDALSEHLKKVHHKQGRRSGLIPETYDPGDKSQSIIMTLTHSGHNRQQIISFHQ